MLKSFINNALQEQEKFVVIYCFSIAVIIISIGGLYPLLLTFVFFLFSLIIYVFAAFILKKSENSDLFYFSLFCLFIFISYINFLYENYLFFVIVGVIFALSLYKKSFIPQITKNSNFVGFSSVEKFFIDFAVIDYHFETEFKLFGLIRKVNIISLFFFIRILMFLYARPDSLYSFEFHQVEPFIVATFFTIILNFFLIIGVRFIIITNCNPPIAFTTLQKCIGCSAIVLGSASTLMGFHVISTTPIFEPLPIQLSYWYQKKILGFKYAYSEDGVIGKLYKVTFHETPPVNVDGFVDVDASLLKFSTLSKEKLEGLFAGVPYHFKPDIVAITGVPNKEIIIKSPHGTKFEK